MWNVFTLADVMALPLFAPDVEELINVGLNSLARILFTGIPTVFHFSDKKLDSDMRSCFRLIS